MRPLQDDSEEEADPTGSPTRRGVAPWLADAARAGAKSTASSAAPAGQPPAAVSPPDPAPAAVTPAAEGSASAVVVADTPPVNDEPALVSLQTLDEPQRLSIGDLPQPNTESGAEVLPLYL